MAIFRFWFLFVVSSMVAQPLDLQWAVQMGGVKHEKAYSLAVDTSGNVYSCGVLCDSADFDPGPGVHKIFTAGCGMYVSKLDASGNFLWAKSFSGNSVFNNAKSIAVDHAGCCYITGEFRGIVDFDPGPGIFTGNTWGDKPDIYIAKLDALGNLLWAKQIGNGADIYSNAVAVDYDGSVYFTGFYSLTLDFDPGPGSFGLNADKKGSIFIAKLSAAGNFVWATQFNGSGGLHGWSIAVDKNKNVITSGPYCGEIDFDPGPGVYYLINNLCNWPNSFVSKLDSSGNFVWARIVHQGLQASIAVDHNENVYVCSSYKGTVDFDPSYGTYILSSTSFTTINAFILKFDKSGNFRWVSALPAVSSGSPATVGKSIAIDEKGNIHFTGACWGTNDYDPGPGTFTIASTGIFISGLDSAGQFIYAKCINGNIVNGYSGPAITVDKKGNIFCTGTFANTCDFDPSPDTLNLTANMNYDPYLLKLGVTPTTDVGIIEQRPRKESLSIYPNPVSKELSCKLEEKVQVIRILNVTGSVIYEIHNIPVGILQINLSDHQDGIYFLEAINDKAFLTTKIIKVN